MNNDLDLQERGASASGDAASGLSIERARLAAIVENSDDAILTKNLDGIITSWNRGAESIFGYTASEAIGQPVTMLIPCHLQDEEPGILARIRRGDHVDHYETIRQHKDGRLIRISLTVSPLRDERGEIVGASKIARDIDERFRAQERQRLLLAEMHHRIKNVFALTSGLVRLCSARTDSAAEMAAMLQGRFQALAQAHTLTVPAVNPETAAAAEQATLHDLIRTLLAPAVGDDEARVTLDIADIALSPRSVTPLALVLNELVTNASKHGALGDEDGTVEVTCRLEGEQVVLTWQETMRDPPDLLPEASGFGTELSRATVEHELGGTIVRELGPNGLAVTIIFGAGQLA